MKLIIFSRQVIQTDLALDPKWATALKEVVGTWKRVGRFLLLYSEVEKTPASG